MTSKFDDIVIDLAIKQVDAALFYGHSLYNDDNAIKFRQALERWIEQLKWAEASNRSARWEEHNRSKPPVDTSFFQTSSKQL